MNKKTRATKTSRSNCRRITVFSKLPNEHSFVLADGTKIGSLVDLAMNLTSMPTNVFRQHVNIFKNDFSKWVQQIYDDSNLARELMAVNEKDEVELVILRKLMKEMK